MRVTTYDSVRRLSVIERPEPVAGDGDIVIATAQCGICGSDVHSFVEGAWISPGDAMGHEFAGTITQVGRDVVDLAVGDRVAINPLGPCGECERCSEGRMSLCSHLQGPGGGFSDYVLVPRARRDWTVFVLPEELSFDAAAFLEPMAVATRAVLKLDRPLDQPILVTGLGSIGQCVVQVLVALGASTIVTVDTSRVRREASLRSGAHFTFDPREVNLVEELIERFGRTSSPYRDTAGNFAAAFECSGAEPVFDQTLTIVRAGGRVALLGLTADPPRVDLNIAVQKEIELYGNFAYTPDDMRAAFDLIASRRVRPDELISHRFALDEVQQAFETQTRSDETLKVMVYPER